MFDIGPIAFEVDVFAGERLQFGEGRFPDRIEACPEVDSLAANQEVWNTVPVPKCQQPVELVEPVQLLHCHEAMAFAAAFRLVILHFELSPTSEARFCWASAAAALRSDRFKAASRL